MSNQTKLPKYSNEPNFVGYPLWYIVDEHKCQCNECATVSKSEGYSVSKQVNWDDTNLWCDECSEKIESAYVPDDEDEDDEECSVYKMRTLGSERHFYI